MLGRTVETTDYAGTPTYYTYDALGRLTEQQFTIQSGVTASNRYEYDDAGNLTKKSNPNGAEQYDYNGFDQLTVLKQGSAAMTNAYNASGIRTAKRTENSDTYFLLDGGDVVAEYTDGELTASYLRGINLISSTTSHTKYYLHNAHGDVVALANSSGTVTKRYDYDAFGNEENPSSSDTNPFRYCGEYFDTETQTYYLRARYYDPAIGRFTQQDPIKYGLNWYVYCSNNPVRRVDPSGKMDYIYTSNENYYIENDWGFWEFLNIDQYFIEFNEKRYQALSLETIKLYVWDSIDENFLDETFLSLINTANQKKTDFFRVLTESVGGDLDFKLQLDSNTLYLVGDVLYNRNEVGNFVWAYFLESHGYTGDFSGLLAQGGSLLPPIAKMSGTPRLDEPWDWAARWTGVTYYYTSTDQMWLYYSIYCQHPHFFW